MSDFWSKMKNSLQDVADASRKAAIRTKLWGELELLRRKLTKLKHDFGAEVWPIWEDKERAAAIYASYQVKVNATTQQISDKLAEIDRINCKEPAPSSTELSNKESSSSFAGMSNSNSFTNSMHGSLLQGEGPLLEEI